MTGGGGRRRGVAADQASAALSSLQPERPEPQPRRRAALAGPATLRSARPPLATRPRAASRPRRKHLRSLWRIPRRGQGLQRYRPCCSEKARGNRGGFAVASAIAGELGPAGQKARAVLALTANLSRPPGNAGELAVQGCRSRKQRRKRPQPNGFLRLAETLRIAWRFAKIFFSCFRKNLFSKNEK